MNRVRNKKILFMGGRFDANLYSFILYIHTCYINNI